MRGLSPDQSGGLYAFWRWCRIATSKRNLYTLQAISMNLRAPCVFDVATAWDSFPMTATIVERISKKLADAIVSGSIRPGERLEEPALAAKFRVSRTPVREALRQLVVTGLVEVLPRRGVTVAKIGIEQLQDMLDAMCELEALCAQLASLRMSSVEKKRLEMLHIQMKDFVSDDDVSLYLEANRHFHDLIHEGTHNKSISTITANFNQRLAPFRAAQSDIENRLDIGHREHDEIVAAILKSEPVQAYDAMRSHNARLSLHAIEVVRTSKQGSKLSFA
jgi:DNA-binding GntR family transcriptional regulator